VRSKRDAFSSAQRVTLSQSSNPAGYGRSGARRNSTDTTMAPDACANSRATLSIIADAADDEGATVEIHYGYALLTGYAMVGKL